MLGIKKLYWQMRTRLKTSPTVAVEEMCFYLLNCFRDSNSQKRANELRYWQKLSEQSGYIYNGHYEYFYTRHFGLSMASFSDKAVLDIGCGPGGSLEWASKAKLRIGLDPLALQYKGLVTASHGMAYFTARSEEMPFRDDVFDVLASFNSIDHVDDLASTLKEIVRVIKPGGLLLLITDVNHAPTVCEPHRVSLEIIEALAPTLLRLDARHFEAVVPGNIYGSISQNTVYDASISPNKPGILSAKFMKPMNT